MDVWEKRAARLDKGRRQRAAKAGYAMPPLERDCPPRPRDGKCQNCGSPVLVVRLQMAYDHASGRFIGWMCQSCRGYLLQ
jgi:hypothetical protein